VSGPATSTPDPTDRADLSALLLESLEQLAAAGNVEMACRLADQACMVLRRGERGTEHRFDALLHRLARRLSW
jgi:hypothetical protein